MVTTIACRRHATYMILTKTKISITYSLSLIVFSTVSHNPTGVSE